MTETSTATAPPPSPTLYVITRSATGKAHAMTTDARDTTNRAVCGDDRTMPATTDAPGGTRSAVATVLGDLYDHTALPVCRRCLEATVRAQA